MELFYSKVISPTLVTLDGDEAQHCVKVLRHREGDIISVIDGCGTLYRCRLLTANLHGVEAEILETTEGFGSHPYRLTMAVCPTKNMDRYEWFVEKATEIGVDEIVPVIGDHSERKLIKAERLERLLVSASKQSLKAAVPRLSEPVRVQDYIASADASSLRLMAYCDETLDRSLRVSVGDALALSDSRAVCILIGPEGDFSEYEVTSALSLGWNPVTLGESRLRTETAAVLSAAAVYLRYM